MREISSRIPRGVRRMTDGETSERNYWIMFQVQKFGAMPELQPAEAYKPPDSVTNPDCRSKRICVARAMSRRRCCHFCCHPRTATAS